MRVLLTTDTIGGVWTFTRELTESLLRRGHAVALVSLGRMPSASQQAWCDRVSVEYGALFACTPLDLPLEWMQGNEAAYSAAEPELLRIAGAFGAELLHANQYCFGALPVDLPKVITAHSDVLSWAEACRPQGLQDSVWLRTCSRLVQAGLNEADAITAPTQWMAEALRRGFSVSGNVRVIANGRYVAEATESPVRKLQAISAGRAWDEAKGLSVLIGIEAEMPILIAGEVTLGSAADGLLAEGELLALFRQSSVYVASSIYEPFGLAPLEAALCGCAVVANDIASLREVWGEAALYFRGSDQLRAVLNRLADDPAELARAQRSSLVRAREYTADGMVESYLTLYRELMDPSMNLRREHMAHAG